MRSPVNTIIGRDIMFNTAAPNRKPEALAEFKLSIDKAIGEARHHRVDVRVLAEQLDSRADALRVWFATTAPTGHTL
jgi:hypothetical protein